jgi:hypothetical protein
MSVITPPGHLVPLRLRTPWAPPPGHLVPLRFGPDGDDPGPPEPPGPPERWQFALVAAAWSAAPRAQVAARLLFTAAPARLVGAGLLWSRAGRCDVAPVAVRWGDLPLRWRDAGVQWSFSARLPAPPVLLRWGMIPARQGMARMLWSGKLPRVDTLTTLVWDAPPIKRVRVSLPWRDVPRMESSAGLPWTLPPQRELRPVLPWGHAGRVDWFVNSPGLDPPDDSPPWGHQPPPGHRVPLRFRCRWVDFPGHRVPLQFGRAACYLAWPKPRRYIVLNSAHVVRLPERTPVPVTAGSIRSSRDKATRDIALTLADPAALDLLRPDANGPKSVEININGHVFTGIIESWDDNRRHIKDGGSGRAVSVSGRSRTALLAAPYAPARAGVLASDRQAQQLIDDELALTDFTADVPLGWSWLVPAGAWAYDGKTRLDAIETIAAAAGAVVLSHPWDDVLLIRPLYPVSPWDWSVTAPDVQVQDDVILQYTRGAATGARGTESIAIPLWPPSATDKPRLIEPLDLIEIVEPTSPKAQAAAVEITWGMQRAGNGAHALVVEQRITLDPAPAEPLYNQVLVSGTQHGVSDPIIRTGTAGDVRMTNIVDPLITQHEVALERGRNALAAGIADRAQSNLWRSLRGLEPAAPQRKGNVTAVNPDGSYTIATADGATIRARPLPGVTWGIGDGVFTRDGVIVDEAPDLPSVTQYV